MADQEVDSSAITQLADEFPQIDTPLRITPPENMNAPPRSDVMTKDEMLRRTAFSPDAFAQRPLFSSEQSSSKYLADIEEMRRQNEASKREYSENHAAFKNQIRDYTTLAFSMKRAGNTEAEAAAYFCVGVTYDNMGRRKDAMKGYKKFLTLSREIDDKVGECLAYNCMGICLMFQACPPNEAGPFESDTLLTEAQIKLITSAAGYHQKHLEFSDDGGQYVANTNIGLCQSLLGDNAASAKFHQDALRIAIRMQSFSGQSVAVGNLGFLSLRQNDLSTAKACLEQHLQLTQSLKDANGEGNAWFLLGKVATAEQDYEGAVKYFEQGKNVAENNGMIGLLKRITCSIGHVVGSSKLTEHIASLVANATKAAQEA
mmetsp:Transcript_2826/g.5212  ORF Transcript_2826/g.5212 Transcript_2826/m.5212 type:complete len:373 (-) Transcript_2826:48-1166(-)